VNFLLDTNIVSEWMKPRPDPGIVDWLIHVDEDRVGSHPDAGETCVETKGERGFEEGL
jgi:hypothetical protein